MKPCKHLRHFFLVLLLILGTAVHSATVIWPAVGLGRTGETTYIIGLYDVSPGGDAALWLEIVAGSGSASSLQGDSVTTGIGQMWFSTQFGNSVDASAMADAVYLANAYTMEFGSIDMQLNQIFYLGFRLDGPPSPDFPNPPIYYIYGWASLLWDGTTLSLVDSAAETSGVGLYAGTHTPIPEPSTAVLALIGMTLLATRRRAHSVK